MDRGPVPFALPSIGQEEIDAVTEVMRSGWLTMGAKTFEFERAFAQYVGARFAVAVSSCTAALHLAFEAIGLVSGDEVLVPTTTFTATAETLTYLGARPVLVDVDPITMNLDPQDARRRVTPRTRAIVPVHLAGQPCDMTEIHRLASEHNLRVVEDAAHALPATYHGRRIGSISELTAFSFYATKTLTTGEGGMVTTDREALANRIRMMRLHGISRDAWNRYSSEGDWYYEVQEAGYKYNFTDLLAAIGMVQLAKCDAMREARRRTATRYSAAFADNPALEVPAQRNDCANAWHLYILRLCQDALALGRDDFIRELKARGVGASVHFIPLHLHPYYQRQFGYRPGDFPQAEAQYRRCLSLPIYPSMREEEVERVIAAVNEVCCLGQTGRPASRTSSGAQVLASAAEESAAPVGSRGQGRGFYRSMGKRLFDVAASATGLLLLLPLLAVVALLVKLTSTGPIFYAQSRVGLDGKTFRILKFRSMRMGADRSGPAVTSARDPRVTPLGSYLRRYKLDELPQLWNVLIGDMSLVGPRPEHPVYVVGYTSLQRRVLTVRPGITDIASILYRDEEAFLASNSNPELFYRQVVLPHKLSLNLRYLERISAASDFGLILQTIKALLIRKSVSAHSPIIQT